MNLATFCEHIMGAKLARWQKDLLDLAESGKLKQPQDRSSKERAYAKRAAIAFLAKHGVEPGRKRG